MNILFLSYGTWEYDGRTRELVSVCKSIGHLEYLTRVAVSETQQEESHHYVARKSSLSYPYFILKSLLTALRMKEIDILFVDNRKAVIPGVLIRLFKRPTLIVQDVRELYLIDEVRHLVGKVGCVLEQYFMRKSNVVISANRHRAVIMEREFKLTKTPLVYENLRRLEYTDNVNKRDLIEKYGSLFERNTTRIVSTSGYSVNRMNDILVEAMARLGPDYELFLIGGGNIEELRIIERIIEENALTNVHIVGRLKQDELKYFVSNCHIGIVNYHQRDLNNKYCASGKVFEFLFEGLPVVTTENPPLMELCERHKVGLADNHFSEAIRGVAEDYSFYKQNVIDYVNGLSIVDNNDALAKSIIAELANRDG